MIAKIISLSLSLIPLSFCFAKTTSYSEVKNQFLKVGAVQYAYRVTGNKKGTPLVLLMHTRGNMDSWDPKLVDLLAKERLVITFDNQGVGLTGGKAPQTFEEMAVDATAFIQALGYKQIDLLAFSIGGAVGQEIILHHPELIRKAILAGTSMKGGEGLNTMSDQSKSVSTKETMTDEDILYNFFAPTETSKNLGRAYLARMKLRKTDLDTAVSMDTVKAQAIARNTWGNPTTGYEEQIKKISIPIFVANGKEDIRMPVINSYKLFLTLPNAQLNLYPDSGHGFLFQYPELVAKNFITFLDQ